MSIESSSPEQLTTLATPLDSADQVLQNLAMKSYLEARHRAHLRRGIAARRLPSEGRFSPGDRVFYWQVEQSKIKQGIATGQWFKARVLSQEGAVCVIDTVTTVLRVNQTKLRKDKDIWNDVGGTAGPTTFFLCVLPCVACAD